MDEKTEYLDGDVVWVKLSNCWWPGEVCGESRLPEGLLASMKRQPIAVVRFFQEDTFEYVKSLNDIFKYNCAKKFDFIKKGLEQHRAKKKYMDKFPADVSTAEKLTGGNPDIINDQKFQPQKRESYAEIFQDIKRSPKNKRVNKPAPQTLVSPVKTSSKMHYLISPNVKSDHEKRFMEQSPPSSYVAASTSSSLSSFSGSGTQTAAYNCYKCGYTSARQNVIIIHLKSCSGTLSQSVPAKGKKKPIITNTEVKIVAKTVKPIKARNLEIDFDLDAEMENEASKTRMRRSIAPMAILQTPTRKRTRKTRPDEVKIASGDEEKEEEKPVEPVVVVPEKPPVKENLKKNILDDWSEDDIDDEKKESEMVGPEKSKEPEITVSITRKATETPQSKVNETNNVAPVAHNTIKYRNIPKKQKREYIEVNNDDQAAPVIEQIAPISLPLATSILNEKVDKVDKVPIPYVSPSLRPISAKERILNRATGRSSSTYETPSKPIENNDKPITVEPQVKDSLKMMEEAKTMPTEEVKMPIDEEIKSVPQVVEVKESTSLPTTDDEKPITQTLTEENKANLPISVEEKSVLSMPTGNDKNVPPLPTLNDENVPQLPTETVEQIPQIPTVNDEIVSQIQTVNDESVPQLPTKEIESVDTTIPPTEEENPVPSQQTIEDKATPPSKEEVKPVPQPTVEEIKPIPPPPAEEIKSAPPPPADEMTPVQPPQIIEEPQKPDEQKKEISCFDFKEEDEEETFVLSKSPRRSLSNRLSSGTLGSTLTTMNNNESIDDKELERKDDELKSEIESLLCDTSVPKLPEMPKIVPLATAERSPKDDIDRDRKLPPKERGKRIFKSRNRTVETDTINSTGNTSGNIATITTERKGIDACNSEYSAIKSKRTKLSDATENTEEAKDEEDVRELEKLVVKEESKKKVETFEPKDDKKVDVKVIDKPSVIEHRDISDVKNIPKKGRRIKQQKPAPVIIIETPDTLKLTEEPSASTDVTPKHTKEVPITQIPEIVEDRIPEENRLAPTPPPPAEKIKQKNIEEIKPKENKVEDVQSVNEEKLMMEKEEKIEEVLPHKSPKSRRRKSKLEVLESEENSKKAKVIEDDIHMVAEALIKLPESAPNQTEPLVDTSSVKKKIMNPRKRHLLQAEEESKRPKIDDEKLLDISSMEVVIEKDDETKAKGHKRPNVQNSNGASPKSAQLFQACTGGQIVITSKGTMIATQSQVLTTTCDNTPMITTTACSTLSNSTMSATKSKIKSPAKIKVHSNKLIYKPVKETAPHNSSSLEKDEVSSTSIIEETVTSSPERNVERSSSKASSAVATGSGKKKEGTKMSPQQIKELQKMGYVETKGKSKVFTQSAIKKMQQQNILPPSTNRSKLEPSSEMDLSEPVDEITPVTITTTTTSAVIAEIEPKSDDEEDMIVDESKLVEEDVEMEEEATSTSQLEESDSSSVQDSSQLIAVPAENFGGPANLFYLCSVVDDAYVPLNNKLLYLDASNQLVALPESSAAEILAQQEVLDNASEQAVIATDEAAVIAGENSQQGFLINTQDGQQIILDQQSLIAFAAGGDASQLLTQDGQQILLQGSAQELLAALAVNQPGIGIVAADGSQILVAPDSLIDIQAQNQDILATALANTDVLQQEIIPSDIIQTNPNTTIETNAILTKPPIMSAVEVPTKNPELPVKSPNLDDSLAAVIGVTSHTNVPTSLELPITVTNPVIAKTTSAALKMNQIFPTTTVSPTAIILDGAVMATVVDQSGTENVLPNENSASNNSRATDDGVDGSVDEDDDDNDDDMFRIIIPTTPESEMNHHNRDSDVDDDSNISEIIPMQPNVALSSVASNISSNNNSNDNSTNGALDNTDEQNDGER